MSKTTDTCKINCETEDGLMDITDASTGPCISNHPADNLTKMDRKWEKPQLIVLARSRPEEAVLLACKGGGNQSAVAKTSKNLCYSQSGKVCPEMCSGNFPS